MKRLNSWTADGSTYLQKVHLWTFSLARHLWTFTLCWAVWSTPDLPLPTLVNNDRSRTDVTVIKYKLLYMREFFYDSSKSLIGRLTDISQITTPTKSYSGRQCVVKLSTYLGQLTGIMYNYIYIMHIYIYIYIYLHMPIFTVYTW